jgi:hypothetical protein
VTNLSADPTRSATSRDDLKVKRSLGEAEAATLGVRVIVEDGDGACDAHDQRDPLGLASFDQATVDGVGEVGAAACSMRFGAQLLCTIVGTWRRGLRGSRYAAVPRFGLEDEKMLKESAPWH